MFTGIVEKTSNIASEETHGLCRCVRIQKPHGWSLSRGQSISVDGICSTVVSFGRRFFDVEYMPETISKTTSAGFTKGTIVNLERSLKYGDRIEGHLMHGHVDGRAPVVARIEKGRSRELIIGIPHTLIKRVVLHGSVALNGVSLTVARKRGATIAVALIPYTLSHTNLGLVSVGDQVNVELDRTIALAGQGTRGRVVRNAEKRIRKKGSRT